MVEVGSTEGNLPEMASGDEHQWKLFQAVFLFAPDVDDRNVGDVVLFYKRYCKSVMEVLDPEGHLRPNFYSVGQKC